MFVCARSIDWNSVTFEQNTETAQTSGYLPLNIDSYFVPSNPRRYFRRKKSIQPVSHFEVFFINIHRSLQLKVTCHRQACAGPSNKLQLFVPSDIKKSPASPERPLFVCLGRDSHGRSAEHRNTCVSRVTVGWQRHLRLTD